MLRHALGSIGAALAVSGALAAPALAGGGAAFPVPSCAWAPAPTVAGAIGEPVNALPPQWGTEIAPVLSCRYVESTPRLQMSGSPIVTIEFREQQLFHPPKGAVSVPHLGRCLTGVSCPLRGQPAWLYEVTSAGTATTSGAASTYAAVEALEVEDGVNQLTILVQNPQGPLSVADETTALEQLARPLLKRFYWR